MALFGWICLVLVTLYITCAFFIGLYVSKGFTGRVEPFIYVLGVVMGGLWYLVYDNFPFIIKVIQ